VDLGTFHPVGLWPTLRFAVPSLPCSSTAGKPSRGLAKSRRSLGDVSVAWGLSIEVEVKEPTCAENHACHKKQTESLPVRYSPQSENLWHRNIPEKLEKTRQKEKESDCESDENQRHDADSLRLAGEL
jgi:hypothetical protein